MDLSWVQFVDEALGSMGLRDVPGLSDALRGTEDYKLAYTQFLGGASDRVLTMLLQRGLHEIGY